MRIMKLLLIGLVFLVSVSMTYAVPEIAYTNFARTAGGGLVLESTVDVRITIFNAGTQVYQEIHTAVPTNGYGLFTIKLGTGAPVGLDTYDAIVAVNTLNVQAETNDGGGYRFVQLSPLLNTALKNEEAAGIVTLNDAYMNGDSIEVLAGAPITLTGTGLIQSDATIAAINANGNKTLTTKEYVDNGIANVADNPFLVYQDASAELPNSKILNGEVGVIDFNAATATLSILNNGISEPKLKMANDPLNGYVIKWNGTDMTWVDPTVITAAPVSGDGTAGNPITLDYVMPFVLNGINLDLKYDATLLVNATNGLGINLANPNSWTGNQTFASVTINGGTIDNTIIGGTTPAAGTFTTLVVNTTANVGTDLTVGGLTTTNKLDVTLTANVGTDLTVGNDLDVVGNTSTGSLDVTNDATVGGNLVVTGTTTSALFIGETNFDIQDGAGIADFTFNNLGDAIVAVDYDATLKIDGTDKLGLDLAHSNIWTADQYLPATNAQGNNLVAAVNMADDMTLEADVLKYDATLEVNANALGFNHNHQNTWLTTQSFIPTTDEIALLIDATNATSGYGLLAVGSGVNDGITDFYYEGDSYQEGFAYLTNSSTTNTTFGVQVTVAGEAATIPSFPTVAQGVTAVASYTGAAPSTNMVIGNVGLAYAGNGIIAIGSYGGAREENNVANVGVVGHAFNDAAGLADINHGVFGMVTQTVDGAAEIGAALSLDLNSGITGVNLGVNANDYAAYFIGKVNVTGNLTANDLDVITTANVGTDLTVGNDASIGNDLDVVGNTSTNTLDVTLTANVGTDLTVGSNANITGTTTSALFIGQLNKNIQDGAGIKDFTFDNLADAIVEVDYDATLKIDGTDKLGFDLGHENTWTITQNFTTVNASNDVIAVDKVEGKYLSTTNYLNPAAGGVRIGEDDPNLSGWLKFKNAGVDVIELGETADDGYYGIRVNDNAGNFRTGLGWNETSNTWGIGTGDGTDFVGLNFTTNNTADESRLVVLDGGSPVFNVDAEGDVTAGDVTGATVTATTFNGGYSDGSILFADASGNITENNLKLNWVNAANMLSIDGSILVAGVNGVYGLDIQSGDGINLAGGNATLTINDYKYPVAAGAATDFMALNATADELEWWNYDNTILVDGLNKTIGVDMSAAFTFTNLVAFNPASGSAISASSSDPSAPTVTIANLSPSGTGVALELVGQNEETTALEITTGGLNIGAGQFIVSSNSGLTGVEPNGPSITINNNGDVASTENGGAIEILVGHTAFSYTQVADQADLSALPYTVIEITLIADLTVTALPGFDYGAHKNGTIIYIVNSDAAYTVTLPGTLGTIAPNAAAQLVYTAAGWIRIN